MNIKISKQIILAFIIIICNKLAYSYSFSYTTNNNNNYICPQGTTVNQSSIACAQTNIITDPTATVKNTETGLMSCGSGSIKCFLYATVGKAGGSCTGDPFKDDPSGVWGETIAYMPSLIMEQAIGKSTFQFTLTQTEVNGVKGVLSNTSFTPKLKVLGLCTGDAINPVWVSPTAPSPPPPGTNMNGTQTLDASNTGQNTSSNFATIKGSFLNDKYFLILLISIILFIIF